MKNFLLGLGLGVGVGYYFHEDITAALLRTATDVDKTVVEVSEEPTP